MTDSMLCAAAHFVKEALFVYLCGIPLAAAVSGFFIDLDGREAVAIVLAWPVALLAALILGVRLLVYDARVQWMRKSLARRPR